MQASSVQLYGKAFGLEQKFLHESGDYGERTTGESKQPLDSFSSNP